MDEELLFFLFFCFFVFSFFVHKNDFRFVFTSSCFWEGLLTFDCLRIVVSNTYCVGCFGFCFFLSSSCVPYIVSFSGLFIFDCPFRILLRLFTHHIHFPHTVGGCILIGNPELTCVHKVRICEDMCLISIRTESI